MGKERHNDRVDGGEAVGNSLWAEFRRKGARWKRRQGGRRGSRGT